MLQVWEYGFNELTASIKKCVFITGLETVFGLF